jgi:hypothetical protein
MSKIEKKKAKIKERINELENSMRISLTKKDSNTKEISLPEYQKRINLLKAELVNLK